MVDSKFPGGLDTDIELPRVDDNITEIGAEAINALRSAIFAIEEVLGINPQGTTSNILSRLNQSLDSNGYLKASALSTIGLVTLPITNSQIASNAGIIESKLDLNYSTTILRQLIGALRVASDALQVTVQNDITNLSRHTNHPSNFGRHYTSDIDGYIGKYLGNNLQGIVTDLDIRIADHITDLVNAHNASTISFDDSSTFISANDVQTAIEEIDHLGYNTMLLHQDNQHSNGILDAQKTFYEGNHNIVLVPSASLLNIISGASNIIFSSTPSGLAQVSRGDRIDITVNSTTYTRYVDYVNQTTGRVYFFGSIPFGGINGTAFIYKTTEETSEPSVLGLTIRQDTIDNLGGSIIQLVHPSAPHIFSNGLDVRKITNSSKNIKFIWQNGETIDIDAYNALQNYPYPNTTPSVWTPENLVIALNEEFRKDGNNYPLTAFNYRGEVGFAYDEPDGYLKLATPSNSAWNAFGLNGIEINYSNHPRRFYIDGYEFSGIKKIVDAIGETDGSTIIDNINTDLTSLGISSSGIVRIKDHIDSGTYVFNASTSNTLTINDHFTGFIAPNASLVIYSDYFCVPTIPLRHTLYELFMDNSDGYGEFRGATRLEYTASSGSSDSPQEWFNIIDVSRDFTIGTRRININTNIIKLGTPSTGKTVINAGPSITLPTIKPEGFSFRLYDGDGINYIDLVVVKDTFVGKSERAIDIVIYPRISEQNYIQIGQVLHDTTKFKHLSDRRLFGTVGRKDIRNDYSRDYISYPRSILRGNGVIFGCEITGSVSVAGGQVLVDGNLYNIAGTNLTIPIDGVVATYNIFVDNEGVLRFLQDNQYVANLLTTPSLNEIINSSDKVIIGQVDINILGNVTGIRDFRRFVNNIDNKIEVIVGNYNESFISLESAINYIKNSNITSSTIKIKGSVSLTVNNLEIPDGTTIEGDSAEESFIILSGTGYAFVVGNGCTFSKLTIDATTAGSITSVFFGIDLNGLLIQDCYIKNITTNVFKFTNINNLYVNRTKIDYNATLGLVVNATNLTNCVFSNCNVSKKQFIDITGTITNCTITDSVFSNCSKLLQAVSSNNVFINNNFCSSDGSASSFIKFSNTTTNVSINDNIISFSGASDLLIYLSNSKNIHIKGNVFKTNGTTGSAIQLSNNGQNINVSENLFYYDALTNSILSTSGIFNGIKINDNLVNSLFGMIFIMNFVGAVENLDLSQNIFKIPSASFTSKCFGFTSVQTISIKDNIFNLGTATDGIFSITGTAYDLSIIGNQFISTLNIDHILDFQGVVKKLNILNNNFDLQSSIFSNICMEFVATVETAFICNNIFSFNSTSNKDLISFTNIENLYIRNNNFISNTSGLGTGNFINLTTVNYGFIDENIFKTNGTTESFIRSIDCNYFQIKDNIFNTTSITASSGIMLNFVTLANNLNIQNNILYNNNVAQGFQKAIYINGSSYLLISENNIQNFSQGVEIVGSSVINVSNNIIEGTNGKKPLSITNSSYVNINDNYLFSYDEKVITIVGGASSGTINIKDNIIKQLSVVGGNNLINIDDTVLKIGVIENNTIIHQHSLGTFASGIIYVGSSANNYKISNNMFYTDYIGSSINYITIEPIKTAGSNVIVSFNNMRRMTSVATNCMINNTGLNSVDYMNWGQKYNIGIPLGHFIQELQLSGASWIFNDYKWHADISTFNTFQKKLNLFFTSADIPQGAIINKISFSYYNLGGPNDLGVRLSSRSGLSDIQTDISPLSGFTNLPQALALTNYDIVLTTSVTVYNDKEFLLTFSASNTSTVLSASIIKIIVNYTL